uniref:kelch-like protein 20 n=1 Tax=Styela clava TaxID=7725 RepID=UPI001939FB6F|nr:kelch-like protein 20 [Styela clava]
MQTLSPAVIYEAIVYWVKADIKNREASFPQLLAFIKLHKLSSEYLKETVQKEALVKESKVCLEMLVNVLFGQISHTPSPPLSSTLKSNSGSQPSKASKPRHETPQANSPSNALIIFDESVGAIKAYKPSTNQWMQMQSLPKELDTFSAVVLDKYIYVLARSNQSLYKIEYATKSASWTQVTGRIVNDACLLKLVVETGHIFIIGDVSATRRNSNQSGVVKYGPSDNSWEYLSSLKTPRRGHSVAAVNGSLYCIGGSNGRQDLNSVEKLDPTVGKWATVASLHHVRYESSSVVHNRKIYVMGGGKFMDMLGGGKNLRTDAEYYDPFSNQWTMVTNIKFPRNIRCACVVDGCIVVLASEDSTTGKGTVHNVSMVDLNQARVSVISKSLKIKPTCLAIYAR